MENIYRKLPCFLQNIAVSIKGLQLKYNRKSGGYNQYRREIVNRSSWTAAQFEEFQLSQLRELINFSKTQVPYYKHLYEDAGISSGDINTLADIQKIPLISRSYLKANQQQFLAQSLEKENLISVHTTGTTGSPLRVVCNKDSRQKNYAFWDEYLISLGLSPDSRHVTIGSRAVVDPGASSPPFWRYSFFQRSLLMSSYHLSDQSIPHYIEKIKSYSPSYIDAFPSSIYRIAQYMLQRGIRLNCDAIVTSSEVLAPYQRDAIEDAFSCKVFDFYGAVEMCLFVAQCKSGSYHIRSDYGIFEILGDDGMPVPEGELGNVVCTGLINRVMPLIRYPIGDRAVFGKSCDCGLNTPVLRAIEGRQDDVLYTNSGRAIGRLSAVMRGLPVFETQYIQEEIGKLRVLLVPSEQFKQSSIAEIDKALRLRVGKDMDVRYEVVESIARGKGGKFKSVISKVNAPS